MAKAGAALSIKKKENVRERERLGEINSQLSGNCSGIYQPTLIVLGFFNLLSLYSSIYNVFQYFKNKH